MEDIFHKKPEGHQKEERGGKKQPNKHDPQEQPSYFVKKIHLIAKGEKSGNKEKSPVRVTAPKILAGRLEERHYWGMSVGITTNDGKEEWCSHLVKI